MLDLSRMKSVRVGPRKIWPAIEEEKKVLVQRNGILDSISFTVARATIPTNYWVSG